MKTVWWIGFLTMVLCAVLIVGFSCGDDDDDTDDDQIGQGDCEEICAMVAECDTPCIDGDCLTQCREELSLNDLECAALSSCTNFNDCLCGDGDDDDETEDDDTGDDDDDVTQEDYIYDDGTNENGPSEGPGYVHAITMTPSGYPAHLTEVSAFIVAVWAGAPFDITQFLIVKDENGDGPDPDELVFTSEDITLPSDNSWLTLDLTDTSFDAVLVSGSWIVGIRQDSMSAFTIGYDDSTSTPQCYGGVNGTSWHEDLDSKIYMIRGKGYYEN